MNDTDKSRHAQINWLLFPGGVPVAIAAFLLVWVPYQRQMRLIEEFEAMAGSVFPEEVGPY